MSVGIVAVQGAFREHSESLEKLSVEYKFIRNRADVTPDVDRLILVGGESTTQRKLINELGLFNTLKDMLQNGIPVMGTCAGLILLAQQIEDEEDNLCFKTLPIRVQRNAYGRQLGSFSTYGNVGSIQNFPMRFIRAPYIEEVLSDDVEILNVTNGRITAVRYKNQIGVSFHPELTTDTRLHELFLSER